MAHKLATKAEGQLSLLLRRVKRPSFTLEDLKQDGATYFKQNLEDLSAAIETFLSLNVVSRNGEEYAVTGQGELQLESWLADSFGEGLLNILNSKAISQYNRLLYGQDLGQYSMTGLAVLAKLIEVLKLSPTNQVLDLGCGVGKISEYLSDATGAKVTGLDFAAPLIACALERTEAKRERLNYLVGNMNRLDLPPASFDTIISIDTLYFARDRVSTLNQLKTLLKSPGQMGIFFLEKATADEPLSKLQPENTRLGKALQEAGITGYQVYDFTEQEKELWRRSKQLLLELKAGFEEEGLTDEYNDRVGETNFVLECAEANRISRYLYHVQL